MASVPKTIDQYLASVDARQRVALQRLRAQIHAAAPKAEECISYRIPAFRLGRMLVGFAATGDHCVFHLMSTKTLPAHARELKGHAMGKGSIRFEPDAPLPAALVRKLVKARIAENEA
jgi:uncharacterized protein YdhG (YjbR/CyaY superfamily)